MTKTCNRGYYGKCRNIVLCKTTNNTTQQAVARQQLLQRLITRNESVVLFS